MRNHWKVFRGIKWSDLYLKESPGFCSEMRQWVGRALRSAFSGRRHGPERGWEGCRGLACPRCHSGLDAFSYPFLCSPFLLTLLPIPRLHQHLFPTPVHGDAQVFPLIFPCEHSFHLLKWASSTHTSDCKCEPWSSMPCFMDSLPRFRPLPHSSLHHSSHCHSDTPHTTWYQMLDTFYYF